MTYQDLLEKLQTLSEDQLEHDVEVVGDCIKDHYYDIDVRQSDDGYAVEIILT